MGGLGLLPLIGLKILIIMTSLQNIVILGAQGLLMLMGSKFLIKMKQVTKHWLSGRHHKHWLSGHKTLNVLWPDNLIKNFDPINIRRPWAPKITMFRSEVMMIKIFNPIKSRRPLPPILISYVSFLTRPIALGHSFFTPGLFWFRYSILTGLK